MPRVRSVNVEQARELLAQGATLLDVRNDAEWARGHAEGAHHIPLGDIGENVDLPTDVPIVTMCHSGIRSAIAARRLAKQGYSVSNLRGGIIAWNRAR